MIRQKLASGLAAWLSRLCAKFRRSCSGSGENGHIAFRFESALSVSRRHSVRHSEKRLAWLREMEELGSAALPCFSARPLSAWTNTHFGPLSLFSHILTQSACSSHTTFENHANCTLCRSARSTRSTLLLIIIHRLPPPLPLPIVSCSPAIQARNPHCIVARQPPPYLVRTARTHGLGAPTDSRLALPTAFITFSLVWLRRTDRLHLQQPTL